MSDAFLLLGFVGIFEIIGGIALGWVLRRLIARQFSGTAAFFLIWGAMFALGPLGMGASSFAAIHASYLIVVQVVLLAGVIAVAAFAPQEYLSAFALLPVVFLAVGALLLFIGAAVVVAVFRQDIFSAAIVGTVFGIVGAGFVGVGLFTAAKTGSRSGPDV